MVSTNEPYSNVVEQYGKKISSENGLEGRKGRKFCFLDLDRGFFGHNIFLFARSTISLLGTVNGVPTDVCAELHRLPPTPRGSSQLPKRHKITSIRVTAAS
jgi:hypothetical protein